MKIEDMDKEDENESFHPKERIGPDQLYDLLVSNEVSWQAIIYELVNTEQLDPWDVDLVVLASRYLEKIKLLEEANFLVSSKVLLAASILLRLKSELLLHRYIRSIDEILFGKKEEARHVEKIQLDGEIPSLYPKTPLPRYKKVSLQDLMQALEKAISTETRRIRREVIKVQQEKSAEIVLPKGGLNIKDRIRKVYSFILTSFKKKQSRLSYSELTGNKREEKIACFLPVLHLDNQQKLFLEQENHFDEIWIWLYKHYKKQQELGIIKEENELVRDIESEEKLDTETGFSNPLANFFDMAGDKSK